jgi:prevent-host-death family protein
MKAVPIHLAKAHLSRLIQRACDGEDVVIRHGKRPVVRLVPISNAKPARRFGSLRGKVRVDESFFEPLPGEELSAWEK